MMSIARDLVLRAQTSADLDFLQDLFVTRRWAEVSAVSGWSDAQRRAFLHSQAQLQRQHYEKHYPGADFLVIEYVGAPIGRLCLDRSASELRVVDIALLPAWQGQGIGSALLHSLLSQADAQRQVCSLSVEQGSRARRLYERLGFEPCGETGIHTQMRRPAREYQE